jgi:hypothetical protein
MRGESRKTMPSPDYQTLMLPVLRLAADGETRVADVAERIANDLGLTDDVDDPCCRERSLPFTKKRCFRICVSKLRYCYRASAENPCAPRVHNGGEGGIRTHDTVARMPHFECGAFDHSATSPVNLVGAKWRGLSHSDERGRWQGRNRSNSSLFP